MNHLSLPDVVNHFCGNLQQNISLRSKKCSSHPNGPHTAKLSLSGVLKHFCGNLQKKIALRSKSVFLI